MSFNKYYLVLYQGLKKDRYYWEFINIIRKVVVLVINVSISDSMIFYKAAAGITFLTVFLRLQIILRPFKIIVFNKLEEREILCSITTLYVGLAYM